MDYGAGSEAKRRQSRDDAQIETDPWRRGVVSINGREAGVDHDTGDRADADGAHTSTFDTVVVVRAYVRTLTVQYVKVRYECEWQNVVRRR